ncbi:aminoglycoside phosphotransferase family protein [uncultured Microbacterium sp.]|uniref:aminoglycoside phosphotransferase family protein n=1 Tax=uncultured Microbacterium sp. TaxID=191216 RepID=UPI0028D5198C|nr:aminoglycoside phosphotransferase family protein [uncultured Microbacterium sp.]
MDGDGIDFARIDERLIRALLAEQFPHWQALPLRAIDRGGNDHRMFRLGDELLVRLPAAERSVPQVRKEQLWLPRLAAHLPLPIPTVRALGAPSPLFEAPWSVYGWLDGEPSATASIADRTGLAAELADFCVALRSIDTTGAPAPGLHSAFRGGPLTHWAQELDALILRVHGRERDLARGIWSDALSATFAGPPVWFHGDVSISNLLFRGGRLSAVVDFGCAGVGDPACDTAIVWTHLEGAARDAFRNGLALDEATWARGRGWALWKGLIMLTNKPPGQAELARHVLDELFRGV